MQPGRIHGIAWERHADDSSAVKDTMTIDAVFLDVDQFSGFSGSVGPSKLTIFGSRCASPFASALSRSRAFSGLSDGKHSTSMSCRDMAVVVYLGRLKAYGLASQFGHSF